MPVSTAGIAAGCPGDPGLGMESRWRAVGVRVGSPVLRDVSGGVLVTRPRRALIAAVVLGSLWAGGSDMAHASPILSEVVRETERSGWPHVSTWKERNGASYHVLRHEVPRGLAGSVLCRWPSERMGAFHCGVVRSLRGGGRARYRVNVSVFEDGSYTVTRQRTR